MNLICSTCHPCRCVPPRTLRRDSYWFSSRDLVRVRYWSMTSLIRLNSRMQNMTVFVSVGGRNAMSSGINRQNLVCAIASLLLPSFISFDSARIRGRLISRSLAAFHIESFVIFTHWRSLNSSASSCQIVSKFFSPVMHMNLHLVEASLDSSPWINHHHLWWAAVWDSVRASHVCWIWTRSCSGRSVSVVNRFSFIQRTLHRSHLLDSFPFVDLWIHAIDGKLCVVA